MPKNKVLDPITDQEIAFARLILSGAMTDRQAAEAVGLNPDSAASTKAKPHVHAYMLGHRAAVEQQPVQQEADLSHLSRHAAERAVEGQRPLNPHREQVLDRLWEIANLSPEITRGSVTGQVKALSMIVAIQNFIPDRRALPAEKKSPPAPTPDIYVSAWLREQQAATPATTNDSQPSPAPQQEESQKENSGADPALSLVAEPPPNSVPSQPSFARRVPLAENLPPYVPPVTSVPDTRVPFSIKKNPFNPFVRPR
jgi:hypothetical protein